MNSTNAKPRRELVWPAAGFVLGTLLAMIPSRTGISLQAGMIAWCIAMSFVLVLSFHPIGIRIGAVLAGLFLAVPCFVSAPPLHRVLLMCLMSAPIVAAGALALAPPMAGLRARLGYLFTWCGSQQVHRRRHSFDKAALVQLLVAMIIFAAAVAVEISVSGVSGRLLLRWFAGGIMLMAFAEMLTASLPLVSAAFGITIPPLMQSPYRSMSISEFWTRRWNIFASQKVFRPFCFVPLARRSPFLAMSAAFVLSGLVHMLLAFMASGQWDISLSCGAFFLVQPLLIFAERRMGVRHWRPITARVWTLTTLILASPLFVEPTLQIIEQSWGAPDTAFLPTIAALGLVFVVTIVVTLASLASISSEPKVVPATK